MLPKGQVFLVIVFLLLAWPNTASAHADLLLSDPAAGGIYPVGYLSKVSLQFNEVLESSISSIEVYNSSMERMDVGDIQLDSTDDHILLVDVPELGLDTYTVVWSVVSKIDGHSTTGLFTFIIGPENEDSFTSANIASASSKAIMSPWEAGIRWVLFSTAFVIFGAFLLSPIVLEPSLKNKIEFKDLWPKVNQALDSLIFKALFLWLLAGFALLIWRSSVIGSKDLFDVLASGIPIQLLNTRFGIVWLLRQLLASWLLVLHWRSRNSHILFKLTLAAGLLGSLSLTSHNAANALWPITSTIIDWLHLLANGAWIGGLLALTLTFYPALRTLPKDERMDVGVATMR
ncbi:MAG: copper resistance protein CopC, partial [Anaerolineales bacterium]|nr:copper resistance protein CopC [Anaerolineales bacterium]